MLGAGVLLVLMLFGTWAYQATSLGTEAVTALVLVALAGLMTAAVKRQRKNSLAG